MAVKLLILVTGEGSLFLEQTGARYAAGQSEVLTLFADLNPFAAGFIKSQLSPIRVSGQENKTKRADPRRGRAGFP